MENNGQMLELLKESQSLIEKLNATIKDMAPLAEFAEYVIADEKHYSMKEAADIVAERMGDNKVGRNKMFRLLRDIGILCDSESSWNEPYRAFIDQGYFHTKIKDTGVGAKTVTLVTGKGLNYIYKKVTEYIGC